MSVDPQPVPHVDPPGVGTLFARAARADRRADARLRVALDDYLMADDGRLDDRTRGALTALLARAVAAIGREIAGHAVKLIEAHDAAAPPGWTSDPAPMLHALIDAGVLRDRMLIAELLDQVRQDLLGDALRANRPPDAPVDPILAMIRSDDGAAAAAAADYLLADTRRRGGASGRVDLPVREHEAIAWWCAAVLRDLAAGDRHADRALIEATQRSLAAHDDGDRLERAAVRLAMALAPRAGELAALLPAVLEHGHATLAIAAFATTTQIEYDEARALMLDPDGDRLWLALRAHGLDRAAIARIGLLLAEADHRRDVDAFADLLDDIAAVPVDAADRALADIRLPRAFRQAVRALDAARR